MPLRVAVRELDNGDVVVVYFDPVWLFGHYRNSRLDKPAGMASMMVKGFVTKATGSK